MSTIRNDYPTKINNVILFAPKKWNISEEVIETEFTTEAGTDQTIVSRYGKVMISAEYQCSSFWLKKFKTWSQTNTLTVKYYDPSVPGYAEKSMRLRNFNYSLIEGSDTVSTSMGLYKVTFDLKEF